MRKGKVISFDDSKGSGYIECEETKQPVYVHWTSIRSKLSQYIKTLSEGQVVEFKEFVYNTQATRQALEVWVD